MAKEIIIKGKIKVDDSELQNAVNELEQNPIDIPINIPVEGSIAQLKQLKKELRNTAAGSEEFNKLFNQIDDLEEKLGAANKASADWVDTLAGAGGSLGALGQGINKGKEAFSSFNNILKTSVIGLIVGAVTLLYQAFSKNEETQKKLQPVLIAFDKILGGVFRVAEPLLDLFVSLANKVLPVVASAIGNVSAFIGGLVKGFGVLGTAIQQLFSGEFSKAIDTAKTSTKAFSEGFTETKNKFVAGTKEMTTTEKEEAEKRKAELEKQAEKRRQILEKQQAEAEKLRQKELERIKKEQEALQKFEDDRIKNNEKQRVDSINAIDKANDIIREKQIGAQQAEIDKIKEKYFTQLTLQAENGEAVKTLTEAQNIEIQAINDKYAKTASDAKKVADEKAIKDEETTIKAKLEIKNAELDTLDGLIGIAKTLGDKSKGIQKAVLVAESAVGIAKILINTQTANALALANPANLATAGAFGLSQIALNNITAGIGIASNIAATAKGLSALGGGASAGSKPSLPSGGGGTAGGGALNPSVNLVGNANKDANTNVKTSGGQTIQNNVMVRAFVSETEITNTQQFVSKVQESAKI